MDFILTVVSALLEGTGVKVKVGRSEQVIRLKQRFGLSDIESLTKFDDVYAYALVEYAFDEEGQRKSDALIQLFKAKEVRDVFRIAYRENDAVGWLQKGEAIAQHKLGDQLPGIDPQRELGTFAALFIEIVKQTRSPKEIRQEQKLDSLQQSLQQVQARMQQLPSLDAVNQLVNQLAGTETPALPAVAQSSSAVDLARQLGEWFEVLDYDRDKDYEVWASDYFEWIINFPIGRRKVSRTLVRGVAGEVGMADLQAFQRAVEGARANEGWLVGNWRVSKATRVAAQTETAYETISCYTFDELIDEDADFSKYLDWLEAEIKSKGIDTAYLPLACRKDELDPLTQRKIGMSIYGEEDGWIDGYVDTWLDDPAKEHLSVLGEFGTGKTWFALHYAWVALQRYRDAKRRGMERPRIPVVVPLRDYAKAVTVKSLFSEFFFDKHEMLKNYSVFEKLNRMGKLLLIFDGFDEMAARVNRQAMIDNFWELAKVVVPGAKAILTCRTEHFPNAIEGRTLLSAELRSSTAQLTGETPQFEVLELEMFADEQIEKIISRKTQATTVQTVMNNSQLLDLARRPVMVELILEALPDIEAGKPVDMGRVYLYAVTRKMENDIKSERTFTSLADKLYFLCELSWEMLSTDEMSLNYRAFPERLREMFSTRISGEKDLDHWRYDMMGQTMLIRNSEGDYTPAHRSLLEFFVAYKLAAELGAMDEDFLDIVRLRESLVSDSGSRSYAWSDYFNLYLNRDGADSFPILKSFATEPMEHLKETVGRAPLTKAVSDLLMPILSKEFCANEHPLFKIIEMTKGKTEEEVGYAGGNAATLLVLTEPSFLEGRNLQNTLLKSADFTRASMRNTDFSHANLTESKFLLSCQQFFAVIFSNQGQEILTGGGESGNGEIYKWKIDKDECSRIFLGHTDTVRALALREDNWLLASGSADFTIRLWRKDGSCIKVLKHHTAPVRALAFSPDGRTLASGGEDQSIYIWNMDTGECIHELLDQGCHIRSVAFSPDGSILASTGSACSISLWDIPSMERKASLSRHQNWIKSISFSPDGQFLVSGGQDYDVKIWNVLTRECIFTLKGHCMQVNSVSFDSSGLYVASGSTDETVRLWDATNGNCVKVLHGHENSVQSIDFTPDGKYLASGSQDNSVNLWNVETGKVVSALSGRADWVQSISFDPCSDQQLVSGGQDHIVRLWDLQQGLCLREFYGHEDWITGVEFSPFGGMVASCSLDGSIFLWNLESSKPLLSLAGHSQGVLSIAFSLDGDVLASGGVDSIIKLWNTDSGECIGCFEGHHDRVEMVSFNEDNSTLISSSSDHTVRFWNFREKTYMHDMGEYPDWNKRTSFHSGSQVFASAGDDYCIRLWNSWAGDTSGLLEGHNGQIKSLCFSPDGKLLASGGDDFTIKFWNLDANSCATTLPEHTRTISSISR